MKGPSSALPPPQEAPATASESAVECSDCGCAFVNADAYDLHIIGSKCVLPYEAGLEVARMIRLTWTRC